MKILRVRDSFMYYGPGYQRMFCAGDLVDGDDPAVKGREELFQPVEDFVQQQTDRKQVGLRGRMVERATAEPGERRTVSRPLPPEDDKNSEGEKSDSKSVTRRTPTKPEPVAGKGKTDGEV